MDEKWNVTRKRIKGNNDKRKLMRMVSWRTPVIKAVFAILVALLMMVSCQCYASQGEAINYEGVNDDIRQMYRGLYGLRNHYDLIIVGAGLSGSVMAQQASERSNFTSLVIDQRPHLGGNCYDYIDNHGIRVSKYGAHIFHTKHERVWNYIQRFSKWIPYEHKVKGFVDSKFVPVPPNQMTVNILFGLDIKTEDEMERWLKERRPDLKGREPANGEEMSLSRVGRDLYDKIFKHYTKKQWNKYPEELDASVLARLPFRLNKNERYFNDPYEALPKNGYTNFFENILFKNSNIDIRLNMDYFKVKGTLPRHKLLIFTGPIDAFYASQGMQKLEYRSIFFEKEYLEPVGGFYQPSWMVNYPGPEVNFTRIAEFKHAPNQPASIKGNPGTVIFREYSTDEGEPYYPVPNPRNQELYRRYQSLALAEPNVIFVGRLASYKYFNMDQAILTALELYDSLLINKTVPNKNEDRYQNDHKITSVSSHDGVEL